MKSVLAIIAIALLAGGCVSTYKPVIVKATPAAIASAVNKDYARVILADGSDMEFRPPRDFGDAWCGQAGCIRKADFVEIEYVSSSPDVGQSLLVAGVGVPAAALVTGMLIARCELLCPTGAEPTSPPPPLATQTQLARLWLDGLVIQDGHVVDRRPGSNRCTQAYGSRPPPDYATDAEALEAIWRDRTHQSTSCVWDASTALREQAGDVARDRAMRLWALYEVKWRWDMQRCVNPDNDWPSQNSRIAPFDRFDLAPHKGDPKVLLVIAETLADPRSYADNTATAGCPAGARPEDEWPAIKERVRKLGPFVR